MIESIEKLIKHVYCNFILLILTKKYILQTKQIRYIAMLRVISNDTGVRTIRSSVAIQARSRTAIPPRVEDGRVVIEDSSDSEWDSDDEMSVDDEDE